MTLVGALGSLLNCSAKRKPKRWLQRGRLEGGAAFWGGRSTFARTSADSSDAGAWGSNHDHGWRSTCHLEGRMDGAIRITQGWLQPTWPSATMPTWSYATMVGCCGFYTLDVILKRAPPCLRFRQ